jgi:parallel beta-helix repeat protein
MTTLALVSACLLYIGTPASLPIIELTHDNTRIDRSCRISIKPGTVIADTDGNGVIQIVKSGITLEFDAESQLAGAETATSPDGYKGIGITVIEAADVTIRHANMRGFKVGIKAVHADGLIIEDATPHDLYRQRLASTPAAEDSGDWLWPHANDQNEWVDKYGAAVCVSQSRAVKIQRVTVRQSQNGIILDRVNEAHVFDNDCSFLSGWGIALWRSSNNLISRNACDFCIRGHSEGIYNRGQDSAGFLVFEQCSGNSFIENSATHCGDGFFAFAGKEALGETPPPEGVTLDYSKTGCNENLLVDNDFSYASAHGIEITFSKRNRLIHNILIGDGICGVWAGYSNDTVIADNRFERNGDLAYGLERGAINIEHGSRNRIENNTFINNRAGVHLWWDDDGALLERPGVKAAGGGMVAANVIVSNRFEITEAFAAAVQTKSSKVPLACIQIRDTQGSPHVRDTLIQDNVFALAGGVSEQSLTDGVVISPPRKLEALYTTPRDAQGERNPVGALASLGDRRAIVMGEWGPWDHVSPLIIPVSRSGASHTYRVYGALPDDVEVSSDVKVSKVAGAGLPERTDVTVATEPDQQAVVPYQLHITAAGTTYETKSALVAAFWECAAFSWSADPRTELERWRRERQLIPQAAITSPAVNFQFGSRGPRGLPDFKEVLNIAPGPNKFGMVCAATIKLPKGAWRFTTLSDDGVRVILNQQRGEKIETTALIENWTWHGPTVDTAVFKQDLDTNVNVMVEYFQLDGHAVLKLDIAPEQAPIAPAR